MVDTCVAIRASTVLATVLSVATIGMCLICVPMIISEVQSIWTELDAEMNEFRVGSLLLSCSGFTQFCGETSMVR